ncbi:MAG: hypothetical protein RIR26_1596 [Pseudomonadota bacterium]|jgi:hypothetical protein
MNELLKLLAQFQQCLQQQMTMMEELLVIIGREAELVVSFSLPEFERLVTEKDQVVRLAQAAEERRLQILKKLCFMMAFDARGRLPSLSEFQSVGRAYAQNVERLIDRDTQIQLNAALDDVERVSALYRSAFLHAQPRIDENKKILRALAANLKRSVNFLQAQAAGGKRYDGRGQSVDGAPSATAAFVRVRA